MAQSSYNVPHRVELAGINYEPHGAKNLPTVSMNHDPTWEAANYYLSDFADSVQTEYCSTFLLSVCSFVCRRCDISHFSHI